MLSLAFVHVISDGFKKMEGLTGDFPIASVFVMGGILLMFVVERASLDYLSSTEDGEGPCCHSDVHRHSHGCVRHAHRNWNCEHADLHLPADGARMPFHRADSGVPRSVAALTAYEEVSARVNAPDCHIPLSCSNLPSLLFRHWPHHSAFSPFSDFHGDLSPRCFPHLSQRVFWSS